MYLLNVRVVCTSCMYSSDRRIGKNCVSRRSKSQKMNLYNDKFDAVRRNPYSIIVCTH